ncbi:unnamed protein product [Tilletia controversa]|nr:unnamed protein product [Tilletia controversa]
MAASIRVRLDPMTGLFILNTSVRVRLDPVPGVLESLRSTVRIISCVVPDSTEVHRRQSRPQSACVECSRSEATSSLQA